MKRLQHPLLAVKIPWTVHHPDGFQSANILLISA